MIRKPILLIAFATLYGCSPEPSIPETPLPKKPQPSLPENPKEVEIEVFSSGAPGPNNSVTNIVFRTPESRFNLNTFINILDIPFRMSREELLSLYHFFREKGFARLSTERGGRDTPGGGMSYITLRVDGKTHNGYNHYFVKEGDSYTNIHSTPIHVYYKIKRKINAVTREKVNNLKVKCEIVIDESIHKKYGNGSLAYHRGTIDIAHRGTIDIAKKDGKNPVVVDLFPGKQTFRLEPPFGQQQDIKVHVRPETERITLFLENGKIVSR